MVEAVIPGLDHTYAETMVLQGDELIFKDVDGNDQVLVYRRDGEGSWNLTQTIAPGTMSFGFGISIDGDVMGSRALYRRSETI